MFRASLLLTGLISCACSMVPAKAPPPQDSEPTVVIAPPSTKPDPVVDQAKALVKFWTGVDTFLGSADTCDRYLAYHALDDQEENNGHYDIGILWEDPTLAVKVIIPTKARHQKTVVEDAFSSQPTLRLGARRVLADFLLASDPELAARFLMEADDAARSDTRRVQALFLALQVSDPDAQRRIVGTYKHDKLFKLSEAATVYEEVIANPNGCPPDETNPYLNPFPPLPDPYASLCGC